MVVALAILDIPYNNQPAQQCCKNSFEPENSSPFGAHPSDPEPFVKKRKFGSPFYFIAPPGHSVREIHENREREGNVSFPAPI